MKKTIIFGNNNLAEMIYLESQKFNEQHFAIEAFCVDGEYVNDNRFYDKPLLSLGEALIRYPPEEFNMLSTVVASNNGLRKKTEVFDRLSSLGYKMTNYISPLADVSSDVCIGENNIVLSFVRVGLDVKLGNSNIFWHSALVDHSAHVGNGNFFAGGCKTAGFVSIGDSCWIGLNATIIQRISISDETLVGAGSVIIRDTEPFTTYVGNPARAIRTHKDTGIVLEAQL